MVVVKCNKCKASLPDGASFCPSCGAPKSVQQQTGPTYQPQQTNYRGSMYSGGMSPFENVFYMLFSKTTVIIGVLIGILLAWISLVITIFTTGNGDLARLIASMGFAGIGFLLIGAGVWNNRIDRFVRLGMVLIGVWAIVQTISILTSSLTSLLG